MQHDDLSPEEAAELANWWRQGFAEPPCPQDRGPIVDRPPVSPDGANL